MPVRELSDLLFDAKVGPATLVTLTSVMSDKDKATYLRRHTTWPRPSVVSDGMIRVPDPAGGEHLVERTTQDWGDCFRCTTHGFCWATHSATREYELQSGVEYERNTGESVYLLRPGD